MSTEFNTDIYELREAVKKEIGYESFDDLKASKHVFADERKEYYAGKAPEYKDYFVWLKGLCDIYDVIEEKKKVSAETEKEREVKGEIYRKVNASYRNAFWEKRYKIGKLKFNAFSLIVLAGLFFVLLFIATLFNLLILALVSGILACGLVLVNIPIFKEISGAKKKLPKASEEFDEVTTRFRSEAGELEDLEAKQKDYYSRLRNLDRLIDKAKDNA